MKHKFTKDQVRFLINSGITKDDINYETYSLLKRVQQANGFPTLTEAIEEIIIPLTLVNCAKQIINETS